MTLPPFHLAFPVDDLAAARRFYGDLLGCPEGRSADALGRLRPLRPSDRRPPRARCGARSARPTRSMAKTCRFRISASCCRWTRGRRLPSGCEAAGVEFVIEPTIRFAGQPGEQATMFLLDPAGNALEFKAMADPAKLFEKQ